jgi:hypothetical protein
MNKLNYGKYKWFDGKLNKKLIDATKSLRDAEDNLSEDRISYLLVVTTIRDILNDWKECNKIDFRIKRYMKKKLRRRKGNDTR